MSFILDALKKSENERQRKVGPSLADVHVRPAESNRPWWAVAIAALLLINLGVLIVALTRSHESKQTPTPVAAQSSTSASSSANVQARAQPPVTPRSQVRAPDASSAPPSNDTLPTTSAAVRSLAEEAGVPSSAGNEPSDAPSNSLAAAAVPPAGPPVVRPIEAPNVSPANTTTTFAGRTQESKPPNEVLPTASDLIAGGTQLPELHLDIHVHAANPADRFVFVNMHKYVEGQTMSEGPVVERITPDGVILNLRGLRFLLPHT
jgi:general secretion pathway protein B